MDGTGLVHEGVYITTYITRAICSYHDNVVIIFQGRKPSTLLKLHIQENMHVCNMYGTAYCHIHPHVEIFHRTSQKAFNVKFVLDTILYMPIIIMLCSCLFCIFTYTAENFQLRG